MFLGYARTPCTQIIFGHRGGAFSAPSTLLHENYIINFLVLFEAWRWEGAATLQIPSHLLIFTKHNI
jgi:hypothetical protein